MQEPPEFDTQVWHILSCRFCHENISMAILPLPLIQVSLTKEYALGSGKLPPVGLPKNSVVRITMCT